MASSPLSFLGCSHHFLSPTQKSLSSHPNPRYNRNLRLRNLSSSASGWEREEVRWLREEQRWLRQESRWHAERESLFSEIERRIQDLEHDSSDGVGNLHLLLKVMKGAEAKFEVGRIAVSGSGPRPMLLVEGEVKEMVVEEVGVSESSGEVASDVIKEANTVRLSMLRMALREKTSD